MASLQVEKSGDQVGFVGMFAEPGRHIGAERNDLHARRAGFPHQGPGQLPGDAAPGIGVGHTGMVCDPFARTGAGIGQFGFRPTVEVDDETASRFLLLVAYMMLLSF